MLAAVNRAEVGRKNLMFSHINMASASRARLSSSKIARRIFLSSVKGISGGVVMTISAEGHLSLRLNLSGLAVLGKVTRRAMVKLV